MFINNNNNLHNNSNSKIKIRNSSSSYPRYSKIVAKTFSQLKKNNVQGCTTGHFEVIKNYSPLVSELRTKLFFLQFWPFYIWNISFSNQVGLLCKNFFPLWRKSKMGFRFCTWWNICGQSVGMCGGGPMHTKTFGNRKYAYINVFFIKHIPHYIITY